MVPLKVIIELRTPIVEPGQPIHLDGLLGALRVREEEKAASGPIDPREFHYDIPLERFTALDGQWCFKASVFKLSNRHRHGNWMQAGKVNLTEAARHRAEGWLALRAGKANPAGGPFKSTISHLPVGWADLTAYCVGDQKRLLQLLSNCRQIGGRRGVGFGQVSNISLVEVDADECTWHHRAMPLGTPWLEDMQYARAVGNLRAPYWDRRLQETVMIPTEFL